MAGQRGLSKLAWEWERADTIGERSGRDRETDGGLSGVRVGQGFPLRWANWTSEGKKKKGVGVPLTMPLDDSGGGSRLLKLFLCASAVSSPTGRVDEVGAGFGSGSSHAAPAAVHGAA